MSRWSNQVAALLLVPVLSAAAAAPDTIAHCRTIGDPDRRLACYDALPDRAADHLPIDSSGGASGRDSHESRHESLTTLPDPDLPFIAAAVVAVERSAYGKLVIGLDNDEVWGQIDSSPLQVDAGDRVRITPAASGSYLLEKLPDSRRIRVRRLR